MTPVASAPRDGALGYLPTTSRQEKKIYFEGYSAAQLAELTGEHVTSARRWKRQGAPPAIAKLLAILLDGDLGTIDPDWKGWHLVRGRLHGHDGLNFAPAEVLALPFHRAHIKALEVRNKFSVQADFIDQRWIDPTSTGDQSARATTAELPRPLPRATTVATLEPRPVRLRR